MEFPEKKNLVMLVQRHLNLKEDGIDGPKTWNAILKKLNLSVAEPVNKHETPAIGLSEKAYNFET